MSIDERAELERLRAEAAPAGDPPPTFQVLVQTGDATRLILGIGPFDGWDPGPDGYTIYVLDESQRAAVMELTAYVCADLKTVQATPC